MYIVQVYRGLLEGWVDVTMPDGEVDYFGSLWDAQRKAHAIEYHSRIMTRIVDLEGNVVTGE